MLDIKFIRENPDLVKQGCKKKQSKVDIDQLLELDGKKKEYLKKIEDLRARQNKISEQRTMDNEQIDKAKELKQEIKKTEPELKEIEKEFNNLMLQIPNLPFEDVPIGKDEKENKMIKKWGELIQFDFQPKNYLEIAEKLDLIDIERAAKVSGSRFGYLKNEAVLLEFALINFAFDFLIKQGFIPIVPPVMIKPEMMEGMGYIKLKVKSQKSSKENLRFPTGQAKVKTITSAFAEAMADKQKLKIEEEEMYFLRDDDLVLVGTSEQAIGPMHRDEIFKEEDLPKRYLGFSSCFRREAGSYGKDTKGILRVHQFDKLEMFSFCHPEKSKQEHQFFLEMEEKLMQSLKIPYQVINICSGDLGHPAAAKYDIEAWIPSENQYRETHSCSNCTDFQARRLNIRYRDKFSKLNFVHTLNGTAFAIGRTLIAIIENYQQKDGSIKVPETLQKYTGFSKID